jgi:hypothetical protein
MTNYDLETWEDFAAAVAEIERQCSALGGNPLRYVSPLIYRGQADSGWDLQTTVERFLGYPPTVSSYYEAVSAIRPYIESFTGKSWNLPQHDDLALQLQELQGFRPSLPAYDVLVYLRHHGFPSPLLDWSRSPFVAAFFAFRSAVPIAERVAIYAYLEFAGDGKQGWGEAPTIASLGPYVTTHQRHYLQQAQYTACLARRDARPLFAEHERVFSENRAGQDLLWKISLPASEGAKARNDLARYNISAHSLFASEETMLESLADHELRRHAKG